MPSIENLKTEQVVPDIIDDMPEHKLTIEYDSGVSAEFGNELTPTQVQNQPKCSWPADENSFYTLAFIDPDAPSRADPKFGQFLHYMVGNIPGNRVEEGQCLANYGGSGPPEGSGLHRYIYFVFKQPNGKIQYERMNSREKRMQFSIKNWGKQMNLDKTVACNFYQAQYDSYVPILHSKTAALFAD